MRVLLVCAAAGLLLILDVALARAAPTTQQDSNKAAIQRYRHAVEKSLRESDTPRDWALVSQMLDYDNIMASIDGTPENAALLAKAARAAPDDRLVQWLWASANPGVAGCNEKTPCPGRAEALARLEPDNGAAWLPVLVTAAKAGDVATMGNALSRLAASSRYDEPSSDATAAWAEIYRRYAPPPEARVMNGRSLVDADLTQQSLAFSEAVSMSIQEYTPLLNLCRPEKYPDAGANRLQDCGKAGRLMLNHANSLISRMISRAILRLSGTATSEDLEQARIFDWQNEQFGKLVAGDAQLDESELRTMLADYASGDGEMAVARKRLTRAGIPLTPPADWHPTRNGKPISPLGEAPTADSHS